MLSEDCLPCRHSHTAMNCLRIAAFGLLACLLAAALTPAGEAAPIACSCSTVCLAPPAVLCAFTGLRIVLP
jgi:hypothetical protein